MAQVTPPSPISSSSSTSPVLLRPTTTLGLCSVATISGFRDNELLRDYHATYKEHHRQSKSGSRKTIRMSMAYFLIPDTSKIEVITTRQELVGLADQAFGDLHRLIAKARHKFQLRFDELVDLQTKILWCTEVPKDGTQENLDATISNELATAVRQCYRLGCFYGFEEGAKWLKRLYGDLPRSAYRYEYEVKTKEAPDYHLEYKFFGIRVQDQLERDLEYQQYCGCSKILLEELTKKVYELVRFKAQCDSMEDLASCDFYLYEILGMLNYHLQRTYSQGRDDGFERGQIQEKIRYGYYPQDTTTYSRHPSLGEGIIVYKNPLPCHCGDCPSCLGMLE